MRQSPEDLVRKIPCRQQMSPFCGRTSKQKPAAAHIIGALGTYWQQKVALTMGVEMNNLRDHDCCVLSKWAVLRLCGDSFESSHGAAAQGKSNGGCHPRTGFNCSYWIVQIFLFVYRMNVQIVNAQNETIRQVVLAAN